MLNKEINNLKIDDLTVIHNKPSNRFEIDLGDKIAVLVYMIKADLFLLLHTEVPPQFEGRGIAAKMAHETLEYAKKEGFKIRSYCSYTTRYIERHKEYEDLLG
jgi:predicted GNAT family acetyltransferase